MLLRIPDHKPLAPPLVIGAAVQRYGQTAQFLPPDGIIYESADLSLEIEGRIRLKRVSFQTVRPGVV